jgi:hypothetical protein
MAIVARTTKVRSGLADERRLRVGAERVASRDGKGPAITAQRLVLP